MKSPQDRAYIAQTLRDCRAYLWDGSEGLAGSKAGREFICNAVRKAANYSPKAYMVQGVILERIVPCVSFKEWLNVVKGVPLEQLRDKRRMQAHRLAWVNQLIDEFSGQHHVTNEHDQIALEDGTRVHYSGPLLATPKYPPGPRGTGTTVHIKGTIDEDGHFQVWVPPTTEDAK